MIHYELHGPDGSKVGDFDRVKDDTICYHGTLSVLGTANSTEYHIYANAGGCSKVLVSFTVKPLLHQRNSTLWEINWVASGILIRWG